MAVAQSAFYDDPVFLVAWIESLFISLIQGWLLQDMIVILVRNNITVGGKKKLFAKYGDLKGAGDPNDPNMQSCNQQ